MADTFTCDHCGGTFGKAWTDEEAIAEAADTFGDQLGDDPAHVCDDCYRAMTAELPIAEYLAALAAATVGSASQPPETPQSGR